MSVVLCPAGVEPHPKRGPWEVRGERGKIDSEKAGEVFKTHSLHLSHSLQGLGPGRRQEEGVRMHNGDSFGGDKEYREPAESRGEEEMGKTDEMTGKGGESAGVEK